jgi:ABC-2 type transport system permease protein
MSPGKTTWWSQLIGLLRYEFLWQTRKRKVIAGVIIVFVVASLAMFLPLLLPEAKIAPNPDYWMPTIAISTGGIFVFLLGVLVSMDSISGEFESGTILPLLAKPVSRSLVLLGKIIVSLLVLLLFLAILATYVIGVSTALYGPQDKLFALPPYLIGVLLSMFVWSSLATMFGALTKRSLIAGLAPLGVYIGVGLVNAMLGSVAQQYWTQIYLISAGTDHIGRWIAETLVNPDSKVTYTSLGTLIQTGNRYFSADGLPMIALPPFVKVFETVPIAYATARAIIVALAYAIVFLSVTLGSFRRAEVLE